MALESSATFVLLMLFLKQTCVQASPFSFNCQTRCDIRLDLVPNVLVMHPVVMFPFSRVVIAFGLVFKCLLRFFRFRSFLSNIYILIILIVY